MSDHDHDHKDICPTCGGSGNVDDGPCSPPGVCPTCGGSGRVNAIRSLPVHAAYADCPPEATRAVNKAAAGCAEYTPADITGPYWKAGSPERHDIVSNPIDNIITVSGIVQDAHGQPIPNCNLDFWQADHTGHYSGDFPDQTDYAGPEMGYRGHQITGEDGWYTLTTVWPGRYKISETEERCAHIHVKAQPPHGPELVTQLYFAGDPTNKTDRWEQANDPKLLMRDDGDGKFSFDFVLKTFH